MNIKEFLIENYIWILFVLGLTIITIIGFLADKKRGDDKKLKTGSGVVPQNNSNIQMQNLGQPTGPINYQPVSNMPINDPNNMNMNQGNLNYNPMPNQTSIQPVNNQFNNNMAPDSNGMNNNFQSPMAYQMNGSMNPNNQAVMPQMNNNNNNLNIQTNPAPVEPINQSMQMNAEPMYQTPSDGLSMMNQNEQIGNINNNVLPSMPTQNIEPTPVMNNNFNQMSNDNMSNQMNQPMMPNMTNMQENQMGMPNAIIQNNNPAPMPLNPNAPVNPMPIPNPEPSTIPNPVVEPQPVNGTPVNFVFGPQQQNQNNNNQYM